MNREYGQSRFKTIPPVVDTTEGFTAIRLHRVLDGDTTICAEVVFWDALGQFFVQTLDGEVPLEIIEQLITEAKELIRYK